MWLALVDSTPEQWMLDLNIMNVDYALYLPTSHPESMSMSGSRCFTDRASSMAGDADTNHNRSLRTITDKASHDVLVNQCNTHNGRVPLAVGRR